MKVTEHLVRATEPLVSFEVVPPLRGKGFSSLEKILETLVRYHPPFIDVTSHASANGSEKKRPGTLGICSMIKYRFAIDPVPHFLCYGFTREETEDFLFDFYFMGVNNGLVLQGDKNHPPKLIPEGRTVNVYASDLLEQIICMNTGKYLRGRLDEPTDFCIGVAGYPEKHREAISLEENIKHLKAKIDRGASYIVTQMFFDNQKYFDFVAACRTAGITVPIFPGLKVITSLSHCTSLPKFFDCTLPQDLDRELQENPAYTTEIGIRHATLQAEELLKRSVPGVHFYVMGNADPIKKVLSGLGR